MQLQEVKDFLRIDYEEDDILIQSLIDSCYSYIDNCTGENYKTNPKKRVLADLLVKRMVKDIYDNRSTLEEGKFKRNNMINSILEILSI